MKVAITFMITFYFHSTFSRSFLLVAYFGVLRSLPLCLHGQLFL